MYGYIANPRPKKEKRMAARKKTKTRRRKAPAAKRRTPARKSSSTRKRRMVRRSAPKRGVMRRRRSVRKNPKGEMVAFLKSAGIAGAGAVAADMLVQKVQEKLADKLPAFLQGAKGSAIIEMAIGVAAKFAADKFAPKAKIGTPIALGIIAVAAVKLVRAMRADAATPTANLSKLAINELRRDFNRVPMALPYSHAGYPAHALQGTVQAQPQAVGGLYAPTNGLYAPTNGLYAPTGRPQHHGPYGNPY